MLLEEHVLEWEDEWEVHDEQNDVELELSMLLDEHGFEWEVHDEQHNVELFERQLDEKLHGELIEVLQDWMLPDEQLEPLLLETSLDEQLE